MITIETAMNEFMLANRANGLAPATIRWYEWTLAPLIEMLGTQTDVSTVSRSTMRRYVTDVRERTERFATHHNRPVMNGGLSTASIRSYVVATLRLWSWISKEYGINNPCDGIRKPKLGNRVPKSIDAHDFIRLFNYTEHSNEPARDRVLLAMLADTGCRRGSLPNIKIADLDLEKRCCYVTEKSQKSRWIYWTHYTNELIKRWLAIHPNKRGYLFCSVGDGRVGEKMTGSGIYQILKRLKKGSGVTGRANPHSFRHSFAKNYLQSGGDVATLMKFLGHSDVRATMVYLIFAPDELRELHDTHSPLLKMLGVQE